MGQGFFLAWDTGLVIGIVDSSLNTPDLYFDDSETHRHPIVENDEIIQLLEQVLQEGRVVRGEVLY